MSASTPSYPSHSSRARIAELSSPAAMEWRIWPLTRWPAQTAFALCTIVAGAAVSYAATGKPYLSALAAALLAAVFTRLIIPVTYAVDVAGVIQTRGRNAQRYRWREFAGCAFRRDCAVLLPHELPEPGMAREAVRVPLPKRGGAIADRVRQAFENAYSA